MNNNQILLDQFMEEYYLKEGVESLGRAAGFVGLAAATGAVVFAGGTILANSIEQNNAKKVAKQWFNNHRELPNPFKSSKSINKKQLMEYIENNKIKTRCPDPTKAEKGGGRICMHGDTVVAYSFWFQYKDPKEVEHIELINHINPKYSKFKAEYCATLAVMSGNFSDSIGAVFKRMKSFNKKYKKNIEEDSNYSAGDEEKQDEKEE